MTYHEDIAEQVNMTPAEAKYAGEYAARHGQNRDANPHTPGTASHTAWIMGWESHFVKGNSND